MIFFRILLFIMMMVANISLADNHVKKEELLEQVKEITQGLADEDEVPLNDPFAGNEGTNSLASIPDGEQEDEMSLYNFKLAGLVSGKDHSYISVVSSAGEAMTLTLGQFLGKNKFIDLRLTEAIFKKEDGKYLIIDFNNQIREADEY
jgi:Tfp pilus assembly protein PilP|tara:strand:- start:1627 stop:2070 length:444 start_codon:yes stop_codon:yes gene_type:complete